MPMQRGRRQTRHEDMVLTHDSATGAGFAAIKNLLLPEMDSKEHSSQQVDKKYSKYELVLK